MKQKRWQWLCTFLAICLVGLIANSCKKDDPFYQVDAFELELLSNVNKYRQSKKLGDLILFHDLFVEARQQSAAWLNSGNYMEGLQDRLTKINEHWEPVNGPDVLLSSINGKDTTAARIVVESWMQDSAMNAVLLDDFIQSGPGIAEGSDGTVYITYFFMKIHD